MLAARFEAANGRRRTFFLRLQGSTANWYGQNVTSHITPQKFMIGGRAICRAAPMSRAIEVDDPLGLEPGDKIVTLRSLRNDPLARRWCMRC